MENEHARFGGRGISRSPVAPWGTAKSFVPTLPVTPEAPALRPSLGPLRGHKGTIVLYEVTSFCRQD